nr:hypothetical protein [uncultured Sphaerochaeta sp.]
MEADIRQYPKVEEDVPYKDAKAFLNEYEELCKKFQLSIGHDKHFGLIIKDYKDRAVAYCVLIGTKKCAYCGKEHPKSEMLFKQIRENRTKDDSFMMEYGSCPYWFCKGTNCADRYQEMVEKPYWER